MDVIHPFPTHDEEAEIVVLELAVDNFIKDFILIYEKSAGDTGSLIIMTPSVGLVKDRAAHWYLA